MTLLMPLRRGGPYATEDSLVADLAAIVNRELRALVSGARGGALEPEEASLVEALCELAFDHRAGKLSQSDYEELRDLYERRAADALTRADRARREALLHQIQKIRHERVMHAPIYELAFLWGVGPRVEESGADLIKPYPYSAPYEDLRLRKP